MCNRISTQQQTFHPSEGKKPKPLTFHIRIARTESSFDRFSASFHKISHCIQLNRILIELVCVQTVHSAQNTHKVYYYRETTIIFAQSGPSFCKLLLNEFNYIEFQKWDGNFDFAPHIEFNAGDFFHWIAWNLRIFFIWLTHWNQLVLNRHIQLSLLTRYLNVSSWKEFKRVLEFKWGDFKIRLLDDSHHHHHHHHDVAYLCTQFENIKTLLILYWITIRYN